MPYPGESASKTGHSEILSNSDVLKFLEECADVPKPTAADYQALLADYTSRFEGARSNVAPELILAIDGSTYEASIDEKAPSRRVGYIKISSVLLDFNEYKRTRTTVQRFVDPFELNRLKENTAALSFALPGSFMYMRPGESVSTAFRRRIFECFRSDQSLLLGSVRLLDTYHYLCEVAGRTSAVSGKVHIAGIRCAGLLSSGEKCDNSVIVPREPGEAICEVCGNTVYSTDALRIHEAFVENGPNLEALNRLMSVSEHILIAHYINAYSSSSLDVLSKLCIVVDGPLAVFGQAAWMHRAILLSILAVNEKLRSAGLSSILVMGFQKTGRIREHLEEISEFIPNSSVCALTDEYRYTYIDPGKLGSEKNFGDETYFGQDFLVKSSTGRCFAMLLPYPFDKTRPNFRSEKSKLSNYEELDKALQTLFDLESAMYGGAVVPIMLAHGNASISLVPGGKVLDLISRSAVSKSINSA